MSRGHFLLDPQIGYLNHGSYGATPLCVLERQWEWQREMERRPVEFHVARQERLLREARAPLASALGAQVENTAFVVNATTAMNWVARSLRLEPGDQVLLNQHEYGAVFRCWRTVSQERGFELVTARHAPGANLVESLEQACTSRTRVVVVSQITSPTAQLFDVEAVADWARSRGILTVVDAAHVPGHMSVELERLGVDFWMGNLHKWLYAPKGSALFYVHPSSQHLIKPVIVSWAVDPVDELSEPGWVSMVQMQATRDPSAFLASPAGLDYHREEHQPHMESLCYRRLDWLSRELAALGAEPLPWSRPLKMRAFRWPFGGDPRQWHDWLFREHRLEVPVYEWDGQLMFRICLQHYVSDAELDRLVSALKSLRCAAQPGGSAGVA